MKESRISIIIPVFNRVNHTLRCLDNLLEMAKTSGIPENRLHIVIVDDGSSDGTGLLVGNKYPQVCLLKGTGDLWWSGAINMGTKYALDKLKTDYILWWNNDIIAGSDYLNQLLQIITSSGPGVIIGSKIYRLGSDHLFGMGGKFDPVSGTYGMHGHNQPDNGNYRHQIEADWFPGMGTTFHRSVFEKIGYVDEKNFPQYYGDSDFTYRAAKAGFRLIAFPELIIHNDSGNRKRFRSLRQSLVHKGSLYNVRKNIMFFRRHSLSYRAWLFLCNHYFRYIGGYYKWKILNVLGRERNKSTIQSQSASS